VALLIRNLEINQSKALALVGGFGVTTPATPHGPPHVLYIIAGHPHQLSHRKQLEKHSKPDLANSERKMKGDVGGNTASYKVRNTARLAPLAGRPCLTAYTSPHDTRDLVDKDTYARMYMEKWGGAPWVGEGHGEIQKAGKGKGDVIVLGTTPASTPSSSVASTPSVSRNTSTAAKPAVTAEERYRLIC
jgi:hypothetical protein